jgi:hypothetical protein
LKGYVHDPERETRLLTAIRNKATALANPEFLESLFRHIMNESRRLQRDNPHIVAFQGEHGAYGELAASLFDGTMIAVPYQEFRHVFEAVEQGEVDVGIVPVENSLEGIVNEVSDELAETNLFVIGETLAPIRHCLPNTRQRFEDIQVAYSHPQALAQCRSFYEATQLRHIRITTRRAQPCICPKRGRVPQPPLRARSARNSTTWRCCPRTSKITQTTRLGFWCCHGPAENRWETNAPRADPAGRVHCIAY